MCYPQSYLRRHSIWATSSFPSIGISSATKHLSTPNSEARNIPPPPSFPPNGVYLPSPPPPMILYSNNDRDRGPIGEDPNFIQGVGLWSSQRASLPGRGYHPWKESRRVLGELWGRTKLSCLQRYCHLNICRCKLLCCLFNSFTSLRLKREYTASFPFCWIQAIWWEEWSRNRS